MARPVQTQPGKRGYRANGRRHLNASLPQQLVFDFNEVAKRHGHGRRDALVEEIVRGFLKIVEPNSKSLHEPPSSPFVKSPDDATLRSRKASAFRRDLQEQEVIRIAREHALQIVEATSAFVTRKPPKRTPPSSRDRRKTKAS